MTARNVNNTKFDIQDPAGKVLEFIRSNDFDRATLVLDADIVAQNYCDLSAGLGHAKIHYAVKANPHPAVIKRLVELGSSFDAASRGEIELCLAQGAAPAGISFGNTIKRPSDIAFAFSAGVRIFAVDAEAEIDKLALHAPGCEVYLRVIVEASEADWPLTRKFGCAGDKSLDLLAYAQSCGLRPIGLSFHVGSQTRRSEMWTATLDQVASIWAKAKGAGFPLELLNIGGGFPAYYGTEIEDPTAYARGVMALIHARFGHVPRIMAEPGRGLVASSGMIATEALLVSKKSDADLHRWVYLSVGRFSGLAETEGEAIRYQFVTDHDNDDLGPCILAGPSCDSADVLYEKRPVSLPMQLRSGDQIIIRNCGAYTSSYSSVGFNGFPPLDVVVI